MSFLCLLTWLKPHQLDRGAHVTKKKFKTVYVKYIYVMCICIIFCAEKGDNFQISNEIFPMFS